MQGKNDWLRRICYMLGILVLLAGSTSCNMPQVSGERSPDEPRPGEPPPEEHPPEEFMPEEELPPDEPPPEEPRPDEQPPEPEPGEPNGGKGAIVGRDPAAAGSIMPLYFGACPSNEMVAEIMVEPDGSFRFDNLTPEKYCVGAVITVTVREGQEAEAIFP